MSRVAIIGSSHVGALRQAAPQIADDHPTHQFTFFAMPGAAFRRMRMDAQGVLQIHDATHGEKKLSREVNGDIFLDLKPFDRIWVIGNRYGFGRIMRLYLEHDVLEWPPAGGKRTMSEAFGAKALQTVVEESCARIEDRFGRDNRVVMTPGPYFSESALTKGVGFDKWMSKIFVHPHAAHIEEMFETEIRDRLAARNLGLMLQPDHTRALHMATKAEFVRDARDFRNLDRQLTDLHHMNAAFGLELFTAFVELHLNTG